MEIQYLKAKNGESTIKINQYYLHSNYNPSKEATTLIEKNYRADSVQIVFGYGEGHIVTALKSKMSLNDKYIVIEPILPLEHIKDRVIAFQSEMQLRRELSSFINTTDRINIILSPNYSRLVPEKYKSFLMIIKEIQEQSILNENTILNFQNTWDKNYLLNIPHTLKDESLIKLQNAYSCPVVIASGGPSLTKQIPLLKEYRHKLILIAAGSALNTLLQYNIEPDYTVSIDGGEANYNHYKGLTLENSIYIYDMYSHPKIRESFGNAYYFTNQTAKNIGTHLKQLNDNDIANLPGGASVATYCLSIALYITNGPIALIGQDLAYTNNQSHAPGNRRFSKIDEEFKKKIQLLEAHGYYDDVVLTSSDMIAMKRVFENLLFSIGKDKNIYNCTEGGMKIEGYTQISFDEFCTQNTEQIIQLIEPKIKKKEQYNSSTSQLLFRLNEEKRACQELQKICVKSLDILKSNSSNKEFSSKTLKNLDKNDKKIKMIIEKTALSITFEAINLYVLKYFKAKQRETKEEQFKRVYSQSQTLYEKMNEATNNYLKHLQQTITIIETEEV
ncbi:motility associated factor glycosyltransferase family protein [Lysinibacillus xylanilyticus]|uniref:motility associated factor glycosyltransferase family protein n=1 Tax=Lysinibacillus xylanilyticus TaxID=582475 RepID=UPI00382515F4